MNVYHFHNGTGGGVLSVIRNLLVYKQHPEINNHVIYTINKDKIPQFNAPGLTGATSEKIFYYSPKWNFYYTCKQLAKLLPDDKAVIVAHDWLELGMVSNLGLQNPVVQFVHGDYEYYYLLALKHEKNIDHFFCVADSINKKLSDILPSRKTDINYFRFPVPPVKPEHKSNRVPQLVFVGRCEAGKGYFLLPEIEKLLSASNIQTQWHIVGEGSTDTINKKIWPSTAAVIFYGKINQEELHTVLGKVDYLVLPSLAEGMPVSVIEAMKAGVIPLVNDLPGGIQEIILQNETGFKVADNKADTYSQLLKQLINTPILKETISKNAIQLSRQLFDPVTTTKKMEEGISNAILSKKTKPAQKIYGSRLDQRYFPNFIVSGIRKWI